MKERIEAKLGCTIEEQFKRLEALHNEYSDREIEMVNPLEVLTWEELDFVEDYINSKKVS